MAAGGLSFIAEEPCWYWCAAGAAAEGAELRDPAALPVNRAQHKQRIERAEWGPRWAQLCPAIFKERKGKQVLVADRASPQKPRELPSSLLVTWYEGLLVLDSIRRAGVQVPWFTPELQGELQKTKGLSSAYYMKERLQDKAATGPEFVTSEGVVVSHRRRLLTKDVPTDGDSKDGWYKVSSLAGYLPPWEAFVHPKCGLYQDFYMVKWGPPYDEVDYSGVEGGSDVVGATWEPDECVPDELDNLRLNQKRKWMTDQRNKEAQEDLTAGKGAPTASKEGESLAARKRKLEEERALALKRSRSAPVLEDVMGKAGHIIDKLLTYSGEAMIKSGWPVKEDDYPPGYGPAKPPGCCNSRCDCMEDWHTGSQHIAAPRPWEGDLGRNQHLQRALDAFTQRQDIVARRGLVSRRSFLEAIAEKAQSARHAEGYAAATFLRQALGCLQQAAHAVPLQTLRSEPRRCEAGAGVLRNLSVAFGAREVGNIQDGGRDHQWVTGPYAPLNFRLDPGAPPWLKVNKDNGNVTIVESLLPKFTIGEKVGISVTLNNFRAQPSQMRCSVDVLRPDHFGDSTLSNWTLQLTPLVASLSPPSLAAAVQRLLAPAYDFSEQRPREGVGFGKWVEAVAKASEATRAFSVAHVLPMEAAGWQGHAAPAAPQPADAAAPGGSL